jgi:hypothetical protein
MGPTEGVLSWEEERQGGMGGLQNGSVNKWNITGSLSGAQVKNQGNEGFHMWAATLAKAEGERKHLYFFPPTVGFQFPLSWSSLGSGGLGQPGSSVGSQTVIPKARTLPSFFSLLSSQQIM